MKLTPDQIYANRNHAARVYAITLSDYEVGIASWTDVVMVKSELDYWQEQVYLLEAEEAVIKLTPC